MMNVSDKVIIDLTENFAAIGEPIDFSFKCNLDDSLLPYPNAKFVQAEVQLAVTFLKPNLLVKGNIICHIKGFCDRCLADISRKFDIPFDQIFYKDSADDEDGYVYSGSRLDVTKAICDEIVLSLPTALLCKPDCKGLCPKCGANLNVEQCNCDTSRENVFVALKNLKL